MMNVLQILEGEVMRFQSWAATVPVAEQHGEWECDYPGSWRPLWKAFTDFVTTTSCEQWNAATIQMLLYIIARDNDYLHLIGVLAKNPAQLLFLAEQAVNSTEPYAKSQIASALGRLQGQRLQVEPLLLRFAHDQHVYVRICALAALANIGSVQVEALVEPAWANADQRMTVLYALYTTNSPQLDHYLLQVEADGNTYLLAYAAGIRLAKRLATMDYQATLGPLQQAAVDAGVDLAIAQHFPPYLDPLDHDWNAWRIARLLTTASFPQMGSPLEKAANEIWRIYQVIMSTFSQEGLDHVRHQGGKDSDGE